MGKAIVLGTFDAESFWRDEHLSRLPAMADREGNNLAAAMDEMLFPFCKNGDVLITRYRMDPAFVQYLSGLGFEFVCNRESLDEAGEIDGNPTEKKCVFRLLGEAKDKSPYRRLIPEGAGLSAYAVLPQTQGMCREYNIPYDAPTVDAVKKVNSKIYSNALCDVIGIKKTGRVVESCEELERTGREFLETGAFLIKDIYGVSGKGNLLIPSEGMLKRVLKYIDGQEKQGRYTRFVVEPFLDKALDFSCQMHIDNSGKAKVVCVQKMHNDNFNYQGSCTAEKEFTGVLEKKGYFLQMEKVAGELYRDGYFGDVCVDSMLLKNQEIVPIIEINARKSMGLINYRLEGFISNFSLHGGLTFLSVGYSGGMGFEDVLRAMEDEGILFRPEYGRGILPLSSNALFINRELDPLKDPARVYKGRFYMSVVSNRDEDRQVLTGEIRNLLGSLGFRIYN